MSKEIWTTYSMYTNILTSTFYVFMMNKGGGGGC